MNKTYHISEDSIAHYICHRASEPLSIDGNLDKEAWKKAPKSRRFVDLVSGAPGLLDTRMAGLWDDDYLYFAFWLEEPALRATFTERDSWIWLDNNVEFFLDGDDC
ncbi:MAG: carbohydrate-binding family 9-like protein, partial [Treponema sp.]|nr:carbohydrate-binding family 9-like protein [Treponema sp.]